VADADPMDGWRQRAAWRCQEVSKNYRLWIGLFGLIVVLILAAGCASEPRPSPAAGATPPPTQPSALATSQVAASPTASAMLLKVYFSRVTSNDIEFVPVDRTVPHTPAVGRAAIEELLKGPTPAEKAMGLDSAIPEGASLRSLNIANGVAYADFDEALQFQVGGSLRVMAIRRSITLTLLQFPTVQRVVISIDGRTEDILQP
jgi:spore germination protein GerM